MKYYQGTGTVTAGGTTNTAGTAGTTEEGDSSDNVRAEESALSSWAGPYVTEMLGRGRALAGEDYETYMGPLTAGESGLQTQAYQGLGSLTVPTSQMGGYTPSSFTGAGTAQRYMNPYLQASLEPQLAEAQRQSDIQRVAQAGRLGQAGAYGGSRQAIMESELSRNLLRNMADITGQGYQQAYTAAQDQFNTEEDRLREAQEFTNRYGLDALKAQQLAGTEQRGIEAEGIKADYDQFKDERDFPWKQNTYMQSLLQGLPLETQSYEYYQPSGIESMAGAMSTGTDIYDQMMNYLKGLGGRTEPDFTTKPQSQWTTEDWNAWYNQTGGMG